MVVTEGGDWGCVRMGILVAERLAWGWEEWNDWWGV